MSNLIPCLCTLCLEYEIFVPMQNQGGAPYPLEKLEHSKQKISNYFGGMTDTRHRNEGVWKIAGVTLKDEIVVWKVISDKSTDGDDFIKTFKKELENDLAQEEILITRREISRF